MSEELVAEQLGLYCHPIRWSDTSKSWVCVRKTWALNNSFFHCSGPTRSRRREDRIYKVKHTVPGSQMSPMITHAIVEAPAHPAAAHHTWEICVF